jgi:hypothetical protein
MSHLGGAVRTVVPTVTVGLTTSNGAMVPLGAVAVRCAELSLFGRTAYAIQDDDRRSSRCENRDGKFDER